MIAVKSLGHSNDQQANIHSIAIHCSRLNHYCKLGLSRSIITHFFSWYGYTLLSSFVTAHYRVVALIPSSFATSATDLLYGGNNFLRKMMVNLDMLRKPSIGVTTMPSAMHDVKALVNHLPDDASIEDVQYHLYVLEKIRKGRDDIKNGRNYTTEEAKERLSRWLNP